MSKVRGEDRGIMAEGPIYCRVKWNWVPFTYLVDFIFVV